MAPFNAPHETPC